MPQILALLASVLAILGSLGNGGLITPAPTAVDAFYTPPAPLPAGTPGDTIKAEALNPIYDIPRLIATNGGYDAPNLTAFPGTSAAAAWRFMHLSTPAPRGAEALTPTPLLPRKAGLRGGARPPARLSPRRP